MVVAVVVVVAAAAAETMTMTMTMTTVMGQEAVATTRNFGMTKLAVPEVPLLLLALAVVLPVVFVLYWK